MNTRLLQINQLLNDVIRDFIKLGHMPFTNEILHEATGRIGNKILGSPMCVPLLAKTDGNTDPVAYNEFFTTAVNDIKLLYDMITDQLNRTVTDMDYLMTWRMRVKNKIKTLEADIRALSEMPPYKFYENFSDFRNINIDETTAYINLTEDKVTLHESIKDSSRVYPVITNYSAPSGNTYEDITNIFDDSLNTMWHYQVAGDKNGKSVSVSFAFADTVKINKVLLIGFSPKQCKAIVTLNTSNGSRTLYEQNCDSYDNASWNFNDTSVYGLTVNFTKSEADYIDNGSYIYNFGLQSLELYKNNYVYDGVIQSNKLNFYNICNEKQNVATVKFNPETTMASGCNVNYYISVSNTEQPANWIEVIPGEKLMVNELKDYDFDLTTITTYPVYSNNSNKVYFLSGQTDSVPFNCSNIELRKTSNWRVQYYFYEVLDDEINQYTDGNPTPDDFVEPRGDNPSIIITWTDFSHPKFVPSVEGNRKRMIMYTTYFELSAPLSIQSNAMNLFWKENSQRNIYVNDSAVNYQVKNGTVVYQLNFVKGINKLSFVTNDYMPTDITEIETNILSKITSTFYCDKYPMIQVSPYDLFYNVRQDDPSKFAIDGSGRILINHSEQVNYNIKFKHISTADYKCNLFYKIIMNRSLEASSSLTTEIESLEIIVNEV